MTLHARVEPDMQHHPVCRDKKVLKLRKIVDMIYSKWPEPPVDVVFLPINRQYLEEEGTLPKNYKNTTKSNKKVNWIAVENLKLLNQLTNHGNNENGGKSSGGMWNGRVPVVEFGSEALQGTVYEKRPSISGSILNYFLSLDAHIYIGTEVSSFSLDVLAARFFRGFKEQVDTNTNSSTWNPRMRNFKYLPTGLKSWIKNDMDAPPGFRC
jgi:hypothetical protein